MKSITLLVFFSVVRVVDGNQFLVRNDGLRPRFGLWKLRGGEIKTNTIVMDPADDYERAEKSILMSVEKIKAIVEKAVADEVDVLFHTDHPDKENVKSTAKKAVADGVDKVKATIKGHSEKSFYPFEIQSPQQQSKFALQRDHRVLNAIEAAERAVLQAITNEVDTLFHETVNESKSNNNPKNPKNQQAKLTLTDGIIKASTVVDNIHSHRRGWLLNMSSTMIEDYSMPEFFLE